MSRPARVPPAPPASQARLSGSFGKLPLTFEANVGQLGNRGGDSAALPVMFLSRGRGYTLLLTPKEAVLALRATKTRTRNPTPRMEGEGAGGPNPQNGALRYLESFSPDVSPVTALSSRFPIRGGRSLDLEGRAPTVLCVQLVGANSAPRIVGVDELPGKLNYFLGSDPKNWVTNVPSYTRVKYLDVYPGVDLVFHGNQRQLEYDFVVSPGADAGRIRLAIRGARKMKLDVAGDLLLETPSGEVRLRKPVVYQPGGDGGDGQKLKIKNQKSELEGRRTAGGGGHRLSASYAGPEIQNRKLVDARYALRGKGRVAFRLAAYDLTRPLIIDPLLSYSTYLGAHDTDLGEAVAVDAAGNSYVTGYTLSTDFTVTAGSFASAFSGGKTFGDVFITKLNPAGSAVVYSTYLGGSDEDLGAGITVDSSGNAYVTGYTRSSNFPVTFGSLRTSVGGGTCGPPASTFPCGDAFAAKLNSGGNALLYSTYLGGSHDDWGLGIALDSSTNAYVTGYTESTDFPVTASAFETTASGALCGPDPCPAAFVSALNSSGTALVYSTYLGGNGGRGFAIAVDSAGSAYVTGSTDSASFPITSGAFQTVSGLNGDAFVTKLKPDGSGLVYSTYLGGGGEDVGTSLAVDSAGGVYVAGLTSSANFPTTAGSFQGTCGGCVSSYHDAFVTKLNPAGSALLYSTFLGGKSDDLAYGIAVDSTGDAYVTGRTLSTDFPTASAFQTNCGGGCNSGLADAFVTRLNTTGSALIYSTYFGGSGNDAAYGIALDAAANAYVTGSTGSSDLITTVGVFQTSLGGLIDAFVVKVDPPDGPSATVSAGSLTFPDQVEATVSSPEAVTLQNIGNLPLAINAIAVNGDYAETNNCGPSVAPGASCVLSVTFAPTTTGARPGTMTITDNSLSGSQVITLSGNGIGLPSALLSSSSLSFPAQALGTTSAAQSVTLANGGSAPLNIASVTVSGDFAATNNCGPSVAPSSHCAFSITFTPTVLGYRTGAILISDNANGSPHALTLAGNGVGQFQIAAGASSAVVIRGGDSAKFTVSASSPGGFSGSISLVCSGNGAAVCAFNPASFAPGQSATLTVSNLRSVTANSLSFTVTGTSGQQSSSMSLTVFLADFSLTASPSQMGITAGQSSAYALAITPVSGFAQTVSLACSGAPSAGTCSVSPASVTLDGSSASKATLTVTTTARAAALRPLRSPPKWPLSVPGRGVNFVILITGLIAWLLARVFRETDSSRMNRSRSGRAWRERVNLGMVMVFVLLAAVATNCGGGGNTPPPPPPAGHSGTPPGTYTLTITGNFTDPTNSLTLAHSAKVTLTVN